MNVKMEYSFRTTDDILIKKPWAIFDDIYEEQIIKIEWYETFWIISNHRTVLECSADRHEENVF